MILKLIQNDFNVFWEFRIAFLELFQNCCSRIWVKRIAISRIEISGIEGSNCGHSALPFYLKDS
jgi:hypothetical protein